MKIDPKSKIALTAARSSIAAKLADFQRSAGNLDKFQTDAERLESEIAALQEDDGKADLEATAKMLQTKQGQLELLRQRIQRLMELPQGDTLKQELAGLVNIIPQAVKPEYESLVEEATRALLPWHGRLDHAAVYARQMPKVNAFVGHYMSRRFGTWSDVASEADNCLLLLDALLEGKSTWQFPVDAYTAPAK